jgi:hypothetical protein
MGIGLARPAADQVTIGSGKKQRLAMDRKLTTPELEAALPAWPPVLTPAEAARLLRRQVFRFSGCLSNIKIQKMMTIREYRQS